jgi:hypothetical protein
MGIRNFNSVGKKKTCVEKILEGHLFPQVVPMHSIGGADINTVSLYFILYCMGIQPLYGKGPHPLLWADLWAAHGKITISGVPNRQHCCVIFMVIRNLQTLPQAA